MTLNRLVRNLAVGAVLYTGCGDGDKTTVNDYSGRDGGAQSQGDGGSSVSSKRDLDGVVQNLDGRVLVKEACRVICSDPNCTGWYFQEEKGYGSADFECEPICMREFANCKDGMMDYLLSCFEQYTCREREQYPGETGMEYVDTRLEEHSCYFRIVNEFWTFHPDEPSNAVETSVHCMGHKESYIDESGRHPID